MTIQNEKPLGAQSATAVEAAGSSETPKLSHADPYADLREMLRQRREAIMAEVEASIAKGRKR